MGSLITPNFYGFSLSIDRFIDICSRHPHTTYLKTKTFFGLFSHLFVITYYIILSYNLYAICKKNIKIKFKREVNSKEFDLKCNLEGVIIMYKN